MTIFIFVKRTRHSSGMQKIFSWMNEEARTASREAARWKIHCTSRDCIPRPAATGIRRGPCGHARSSVVVSSNELLLARLRNPGGRPQRADVIGQALGPASLLADLGQPDATTTRLCAAKAPAGDRPVTQGGHRAVDLGAMATLLARHFDRQAGAREIGKSSGRSRCHRC